VWHHDIEEDHIDRLIGAELVQCRPAVERKLHLVRPIFQLELDDAADVGFVVNDQDLPTRLLQWVPVDAAVLAWERGQSALVRNSCRCGVKVKRDRPAGGRLQPFPA
jgi:hypothetical protein